MMQAKVDIGFDQLVEMARKLPTQQWSELKAAVEAKSNREVEREEFKKFLLAGPTFSKKQLNTIAETRKAINKWRTK